MNEPRRFSAEADRPKLNDALAALRSLIEKRPVGAKLPSDRIMARELGISNVTVFLAMQELETRARGLGAASIGLHVSAQNEAAHLLYEKLKYVVAEMNNHLSKRL